MSLPAVWPCDPAEYEFQVVFAFLEGLKRILRPITAKIEEKMTTELDTGRKWYWPLRENRAKIPYRKPQPKCRFKKLERERTASKTTQASVQILISHFTK